jgi:hypothetical protein
LAAQPHVLARLVRVFFLKNFNAFTSIFFLQISALPDFFSEITPVTDMQEQPEREGKSSDQKNQSTAYGLTDRLPNQYPIRHFTTTMQGMLFSGA